MHKVLVPRGSGVHRFACELDFIHPLLPNLILWSTTGLSLYRALLRRCSPAAAGDAPWRDETKFLVKQRFRRYTRLQSPSQIANALKAGYEVRVGEGFPGISPILNCEQLDLGSGLARSRT